ncbi:MAG: hypothetical protein JWM82_2592 [Myxococcales bacterium]|nr:hypothetical protein [Myxococcales bacterium]
MSTVTNLGRWWVVAAGACLLALVGCGTSAHPNPDAKPSDGKSSDGTPSDVPADGTDAPTINSNDASKDASSDADAGQDRPAPTVVATLGAVPVSLALNADLLYVTLAETAAGQDGKVVSVSKAGVDATPDAGVTTFVSGLNSPRAIAVSDGRVLWADAEMAFPHNPDVNALPLAGGTPTEVVAAFTMTRLPIAGSVLYALTGNTTTISAVPLASVDAGAPTLVYPGNPPNGIVNPDSDGAFVYFFTNGTTNLDLLKVAVGGGAATTLAMNATSGSVNFDYLVDDASTIYWSDSGSGSIFSLPKAGGTTKSKLATISSGSAAVQLVLDGENIYALSPGQLARFPKAGGTPVVLASVSDSGSERYVGSLGNVVALAVDDAFVYWLYTGHGQILKLAK